MYIRLACERRLHDTGALTLNPLRRRHAGDRQRPQYILLGDTDAAVAGGAEKEPRRLCVDHAAMGRADGRDQSLDVMMAR